MSGSVFVREKVAWIGSYGTYDQIIQRIKRAAEELNDCSIVERISKAMEPYLRHLELRGVEPDHFRALALAAERAHREFSEDGPDSYGGDPNVYDRVDGQFRELLAHLQSDPRMHAG